MDLRLNPKAEIFIPFDGKAEEALEKTSHLVVAAHQDDIEIMAQHGILTCFGNPEDTFSAVVCSDGAGSPRTGIYADYTDEEMMQIRILEQKKAALIGNYGFLALLSYSSKSIKDAKERALVDDIKSILLACRPRIVYTHNPADKHDTHISVSLRVIRALQELAPDYKPDMVYGCEVWRGLDWINDDEKIALDVSGHPALRASLLGVFDSQIEGGKRYDLAALGRQAANATFYASHDTDTMDAAIYAVDLTPLIEGGDAFAYMKKYIDRFSADVENRIRRFE